MTNEPTEADVTETVEDPGNAEADMALRSAQDIDDPTGRRGHAGQNPDGPEGAAGENELPEEGGGTESVDKVTDKLDERPDAVDDPRG